MTECFICKRKLKDIGNYSFSYLGDVYPLCGHDAQRVRNFIITDVEGLRIKRNKNISFNSWMKISERY